MNKAYEFYKTKEGSECLDRFIFAEAYAKKCIREMTIHIEKGITDTDKDIVEKQFENWMQGFYPYAKYTNSLSKKWILKFAEFYAKQKTIEQ